MKMKKILIKVGVLGLILLAVAVNCHAMLTMGGGNWVMDVSDNQLDNERPESLGIPNLFPEERAYILNLSPEEIDSLSQEISGTLEYIKDTLSRVSTNRNDVWAAFDLVRIAGRLADDANYYAYSKDPFTGLILKCMRPYLFDVFDGLRQIVVWKDVPWPNGHGIFDYDCSHYAASAIGNLLEAFSIQELGDNRLVNLYNDAKKVLADSGERETNRNIYCAYEIIGTRLESLYGSRFLMPYDPATGLSRTATADSVTEVATTARVDTKTVTNTPVPLANQHAQVESSVVQTGGAQVAQTAAPVESTTPDSGTDPTDSGTGVVAPTTVPAAPVEPTTPDSGTDPTDSGTGAAAPTTVPAALVEPTTPVPGDLALEVTPKIGLAFIGEKTGPNQIKPGLASEPPYEEVIGSVWDSQDSEQKANTLTPEERMDFIISALRILGESNLDPDELKETSSKLFEEFGITLTLDDVKKIDNPVYQVLALDKISSNKKEMETARESCIVDLNNAAELGNQELQSAVLLAAAVINSGVDAKMIVDLLQEKGLAVIVGNIIITGTALAKLDPKKIEEIIAVLKNLLKDGNKMTAITLVFGNAAGFYGIFLNALSVVGFVPGLEFNLENFLKNLIKSILEAQPISKTPLKNLLYPLVIHIRYLQYGLLALVFILLKKRGRRASLGAIYVATTAGINNKDEPLKILINVKLPQKSPELTINSSRLERRICDQGGLTADVARLVPKQNFILNSSELKELDADTDKRLSQLKYWANYISNMKNANNRE